jgi:Sugar phosphate permease
MEETKLTNQSEPWTAPQVSICAFSSPYRWVILNVAFFVQVCCSLVISCLSPLGPYIKEDLGISYVQLGLLFSVCNLGSMVILTFTGHLVDKAGVRKIMLMGQIILGICVAAAAITNAQWQLLLVLFLAGICNSIAGPTTVKAIVTWFAPKSRATAMGIKQAGIPVAGIVAGAVLPTVAIAFGWRAGIAIIGAVIALSGVISFMLYRDSDIMKEMRKAGISNITWREVVKDVFTRDIVFLSVGCAFLMGVQFAFTSYLVVYLGGVFTAASVAAPVILAGTFYSINSAGGMIGRVGLGLVSDRLFGGKRKGTLIGVNAIGVIILLMMAFGVPGMGVIGIGILVFLFGLTAVSFTGLQLSMVSELAGFKASGVATGFTLALSFGGMMLVPPIYGYVVDATSGYFWGWILLALLAAIGVALLLPIRESQGKSLQNIPNQ